MKGLVILLALMAAGKVGVNQYLASNAKNEIIVAAYRERAAGACEKAAQLQHIGIKQSWTKPSEIWLVVGKASLSVHFWQVDHSLWQARYKNPYLFLRLNQSPKAVFCEFDVVQGAAAIYRM